MGRLAVGCLIGDGLRLFGNARVTVLHVLGNMGGTLLVNGLLGGDGGPGHACLMLVCG